MGQTELLQILSQINHSPHLFTEEQLSLMNRELQCILDICPYYFISKLLFDFEQEAVKKYPRIFDNPYRVIFKGYSLFKKFYDTFNQISLIIKHNYPSIYRKFNLCQKIFKEKKKKILLVLKKIKTLNMRLREMPKRFLYITDLNQFI
jgi:hypothetical protein